ncbi:MAG: hypothetical protein R3249_10390 [Nitriliruptorales bacterium]|nr:hypothetical protein [Nitriliruptorales bacterium]
MLAHRTDPFSLVAGAIFLVIGVIATFGALTFTDLEAEWIGPILLGVVGVALIASVPIRNRQATAGPEADAAAEIGEPSETEESSADA